MSSGGDSIRMCGFSAFFRWGMQYFDTMKVPRVLIPIIRSKRFMSVPCELVRLIALALLTQISMPPYSAIVASIAASRAHLFGGCVDRALQFWMRLGGLGCNCDVGAIACRAQRDGKPDAAACPGDEQRLALQRGHRSLQSLSARMKTNPTLTPW